MKITELRIGNLINFSSQGIVKTKKVTVSWFVQNEENEYLLFWEPIPITHDLLLKINTDTPIQLHEKGGVLIFGGWQHHIVYLHQLQNLWFALVGIELKVNL
jgi:hypothetical protein